MRRRGCIRTVKPDHHVLAVWIPDPEGFCSAFHGHARGLEAFLLCVGGIGGFEGWHEGSCSI